MKLNNIDVIIPISNVNGPDFNDRLNNIKKKIELYPDFVKLIFVEQVIDGGYNMYKYYLSDYGGDWYTAKYSIFNKSWLINLGYNISTSPYFIISESDCIPDGNIENYFKDLLYFLEKIKPNWCFGWNRINYLDRDRKTIIRDDTPKCGMAEGGMIIFEKEFFEKIGMSNELFRDLGGMDNELIRRAEYYCKSKIMFPWKLIHNFHEKNYMKSEDWRNAKYRNDNIKIYNFVCRNLQYSIDFLRNNKQGLLGNPLCAKISMKEFFGRRK